MGQQQSKPAPAPVTEAPQRLYDLDNFRTYLTALVIYHHTAVPYGGSGGWMYHSKFHTPHSSPSLMVFNAVNQTYFMGSFFFLSGYFSSKALRRKGTKEFLSTKLFKLGLPTLAFSFFGSFAQRVLIRLCNGEPVGWNLLLNHLKSIRGVRGPVWYLALVLVLDTLYSLFPSITTYTSRFHFPTTFVLDVTANFLIRLIYPVGKIFTPLNLQLGYAPQYITAYFLGASLSEPQPPLNPTSRDVLIATSVLSFATAVSLPLLYPRSYAIDSLTGGSNPLALGYAVWNESTGYLLGTTILGLFKSKGLLNRKWGDVGRYSYAAFLVHPIVVVGVQALCNGWEVGGVLKTAVLGTVSVLGSWGLGWVLVMIPGVASIIQ